MLDWLFGKKKQQQPKKQKKNSREDNKWKYDLLVQFLCSPQWRVTVLNFVDQNCIVFDNEQQNKFAYTDIHKKFKKLVAGLFDSVMGQIGLAQDQLIQLVAQGLQSKNKKLFEQLLICDDFMKFKEIMVKRNKALEQQAANQLLKQGNKSKLIEAKQPKQQLQRPPALNGQKTAQEIQAQMIQKAIQQSEKEQQVRVSRVRDAQLQQMKQYETQSALRQSQKQQKQREEQQHIAQMRQSARKYQQFISQQQRQKQEEQRKQIELEKHQQDIERLRIQQQKRNKEKAKSRELPPVKKLDRVPKMQPTIEHVVEPVVEQPIVPPPIEPIRSEEKKVETQQERKKRLLQQREILKNKKMLQRQKQLENQSQQVKNVQNIVLDDQGFHDSRVKQQSEQQDEKIGQEQIERRRNLMKRIKNKIIQDI